MVFPLFDLWDDFPLLADNASAFFITCVNMKRLQDFMLHLFPSNFSLRHIITNTLYRTKQQECRHFLICLLSITCAMRRGCRIVSTLSSISIQITRVGQNRTSAPYMTVCMVISLLKIPYVHHIYLPINVWFWPTLQITSAMRRGCKNVGTL